MKIRLVDEKLKLIHETELDGPPPDAIYFRDRSGSDEFFTRFGIADGVATYRPGTGAVIEKKS